MSESRAHDRWLVALLAVGLLIMGSVFVKGLLPSWEADGDPARSKDMPEIRITRRRVSGLSRDEILAAGLSLREAMYYEKLADGTVLCRLCPNRCWLAEGERGSCRTRVNVGGKLRTIVYGRLVAVNDDPIEKKPIFHFLPGTRAFSIATAGCNLGCVFCQNWEISQALPEKARHTVATPEQVVATAKRLGCRTIAYTYTEPTIFYEFMLDCARLARKEGIRNLWITCGYINEEPLRKLCKVMDAANIDLKGYSENYYNEYLNATLQPVLNSIRIAREEGVWVEVTNLVIPGANDDPEMIREMCKWIVANVGTDVPLHFSRFFPNYRMRDKPPTPLATLVQAMRIAEEEGIRHVYIGNVATEAHDDTFCPKCGRVLIKRRGYDILRNDLSNGRCPQCGEKVAGVWTPDEPETE